MFLVYIASFFRISSALLVICNDPRSHYLRVLALIASLVTRYKDECIVGYQTRVSET